MANCLILHPAKLRGSLLCRDSEAPVVELDWEAAVARLAPDGLRGSKLSLRSARPGDFLGVRTKAGKQTTFLISIRARSTANVEWLLKKIPDFGESVREIFRVEQVSWEARMVESVA